MRFIKADQLVCNLANWFVNWWPICKRVKLAISLHISGIQRSHYTACKFQSLWHITSTLFTNQNQGETYRQAWWSGVHPP